MELHLVWYVFVSIAHFAVLFYSSSKPVTWHNMREFNVHACPNRRTLAFASDLYQQLGDDIVNAYTHTRDDPLLEIIKSILFFCRYC